MSFWKMQLHPNSSKDFTAKKILEILDCNVIGMGAFWDGDRGQPEAFRTKMQIGDVVLIHGDSRPIALVKVVSHWYENNDDTLWFSIARKVIVISTDGSAVRDKFHKSTGINWTENLYLPNTLNISNESSFIRFWYMQEENNKIISVLKSKGQIILQGPPGTGKTFMAKKIAKSLIENNEQISVKDKLNNILKSFDPSGAEAKERKERNNELITRFMASFAIDKLQDMQLDDYCIGRGDKNNFCWWLERGLKPLSYYFPGSSRTYLMYWSKGFDEYSKHGFIKEEKNNEKAFSLLKEKLIELIKRINLDESLKLFGESFILKVLSTYYPDEYFPINSVAHIRSALGLLGKKTNSSNPIELNQILLNAYREKVDELNLELSSLEFSRVLYQGFNLKGAKGIDENDTLQTQGEYRLIQFHPSYTYEDFVRGIVAKTEGGQVSYQVENKMLAEIAKDATNNESANFVLIIDEINRANLPSVLGELIYALEYRGESINTPYEYLEDGATQPDSAISLPENLYIIGTMNTADRSVGHIDYAIRRRFSFISVLPDSSVIANEFGQTLFDKVARLFDSDYLAPDFNKDDVQLGHSYFMAESKEELGYKLEYEIKPILFEYLNDGILISAAKKQIEMLVV